jgi:uncharacterized membrane protein
LGWWGQDAAASLTTGRQALRHSWQTERLDWGLLALLLFVGAGLRGLFLFQPMRTDEALTYLQFASKPLLQALADYAAPNNHLWHTFWVHLSTRLFGEAEWAIRLPALLAGLLLIPLTYGAIRALYGRQAALFAAALVTIASYLIEYSTNARGYTIQACVFMLCVGLVRWLYLRPRPFVWTMFVLCAALGFYTIPTFLYGYAALMLWLLWLIWDTPSTRALGLWYWLVAGIGTVGLTGLLYLPVLLLSGLAAITDNEYVVSREVFLQELLVSLGATAQRWHTSLPLPLIGLVLIGLMVAVRYHGTLGTVKRNVVYPLLLAIGAILAFQQVSPFVRVWLYFLPLYLGIASAGIIYLAQRWQVKSATLILMALVLWGGVNIVQTRSPYTSIETGTFRDAPAVTQFLQTRLQAGDKVLYEHPSGESLTYYFRRAQLDFAYLERDFTPRPRVYVVLNSEYPQTAESVLRQNGANAANYQLTQLAEFPQALIYLAQQR